MLLIEYMATLSFINVLKLNHRMLYTIVLISMINKENSLYY